MSFTATPVQVKLIDALTDGKSRIVGFGGGIRGTKTWGSLASIITLAKIFPGSRWVIMRKDLERVKKTTIPSFQKLAPLAGDFLGRINQQDWDVECTNGSKLIFMGENIDRDPDLMRLHGMEFNGFLGEEGDELSERTAHKAIERAGTWIIPGLDHQPPPISLYTFNPNPRWPKRWFYTPWKMGTIQPPYAFIPTTAADNPYISDEQREAWTHMPEHEYRRFVLGDWESLTGAYYDTLDLTPTTGHVIEPFEPPSHWRFWASYDWGYGHWAVFMFWCTDEDGIDYLIESVWLRRAQDTEQAIAFNDEARTLRATACLKQVYAGHDCWSVVTARGASGETTFEIFARSGILLLKADIDKINGGRAVNRQLHARRIKIMRTKGNLKGVDQLGEIMPDELDIRKPGKVDCDTETGEGGDDWADAFRYGVATHILAAKPLHQKTLPDDRNPGYDYAAQKPKARPSAEETMDQLFSQSRGAVSHGRHRVPRR
jgi:hypothetical protein